MPGSRTGASAVVAALTLAALAARAGVAAGLTAGLLLALALTPLWWPHLRRSRFALAVAVLGLACVVSSAWLTWWSAADHDVSRWGLVETAALLATLVCGVGCVLWARTLLPVWAVGAVYGLGLFAGVGTGGMFATNAWRFGFSLPTTVLLLALAARFRRTSVDLLAVGVLAVVSAVNGGRSSSAILALVGLLALWQARRPRPPSAAATARTVLFFGALAAGVYLTVQAAVLEGLLGDAARERSEAQIATGGTLITGGRPEMGATLALVTARAWGYGGGTVPSPSDVATAKAGMAALGYDPDNGYVESYLFGSGFELHSVVGDLWAWSGIPGLALALALVVFLVVRLASVTASRTGSALVLFLGLRSLWNMFFSPAESSLTVLVLAVGLLALSGGLSPGPRAVPAAAPPLAAERAEGRS
ncbi:hypothetical protein [Xylanimonas oleitrophica]|uniref:hypothetical protein n=1 Tax=Xylanimonas oleitrophica TaxID=2607479 RepID=UPI0015D00A7A|nr:hypothetical protein [Xylanimonas oleitrophica]